MRTILKTLVGSRLHGLNNNDSDYDYRGIFVEPVIEIISPFRKQKNTSWFEDKENHKEDQTIFELSNFCKMATSGNPTVLEILWSDKIEIITEEAEELINNREKFLSKDKVYLAGKGYGENQLKKCGLDSPNERTPKAVISYIRSLRQTRELLESGNFTPVYLYPDRNFIMDIKYNFNSSMIPRISEMIYQVRKDLDDAYKNSKLMEEPDINWIEDYLMRTYLKNYDES